MNAIFTNPIFIIGAILSIVLGLYELRHRHVVRRRRERSCIFCGNPSPRRIFLRIRKPVDPDQSIITRFFARITSKFVSRFVMILQVQRVCEEEGCSGKGKYQLERTDENKLFGLVKLIFHPEECKENAKPDDFLGEIRRRLVKNSRVVFHRQKPPLEVQSPVVPIDKKLKVLL